MAESERLETFLREGYTSSEILTIFIFEVLFAGCLNDIFTAKYMALTTRR